MSRQPGRRLDDVLAAVAAIDDHLRRGPVEDPVVVDAVRARLIEIGEAVKDLPSALLEHEPTIPWKRVAQMRDHLAHRYLDTSPEIADTVRHDLPVLRGAVERLRLRVIAGDD